MPEYQTHSFNVLFDGTFEDLKDSLEDAGFQVQFHPPGLKNSTGTLIIEKTPQQTELENEQAKTCGRCDNPCGQPWCPSKGSKNGDS